jgi:hypothetical protein
LLPKFGLDEALARLPVRPPGAAPMPRQPKRRDQHQIESQVEPGEIGAGE